MGKAPKTNSLAQALTATLAGVSVSERLTHDPLQFARRFLEEGRPKREIEAMALFSAMLSYGKVDLFLGVIQKVLDLSHDRFLELICTNRCPENLPKYRLSTAGEIWLFARAIGRIVQVDKGLWPSFHAGWSRELSIHDGLISLRSRLVEEVGREGCRMTHGLAHLMPDPALGGACKRWLMFLRWMGRPDDGLDLGLWSEIPTSSLLIPIDRHVSAIARALGFTKRHSDDWKTAQEITEALKALAPGDPVRFDFALAHLGISGTCAHGRSPEQCQACGLRDHCVPNPVGPTHR